MAEALAIAVGKYTYVHEVGKGPPEAIDAHHIVVRRSREKGFNLCLFTLLLFAYPTFLLFRQGKLDTLHIWSLVIMTLLMRLFLKKPVKKESVLILPAFGVQLETQYGRYLLLLYRVRQFVPISRILKPVLTECVTPITCYWSLSLIIRGEEELMLVFKELRPPVKMLAPIWKALCAAIECGECTETIT
ncbi:uncharacterized protein LOC107009240 isoform X1 [Solanum pennellii]|uniref:Uncharacterized protein LOC107009240 isoform X1 n=1 Tax=Solanum pennellii TaxID=28526 RepID=A0ABM1G016_SOLPN|nr:uncharacterized protein LOC107009240 isoform X1 [Solanum pennellii]